MCAHCKFTKVIIAALALVFTKLFRIRIKIRLKFKILLL